MGIQKLTIFMLLVLSFTFTNLSFSYYDPIQNMNFMAAKTAPASKSMIETGLSTTCYGISFGIPVIFNYYYGLSETITFGMEFSYNFPYPIDSFFFPIQLSPYIAFKIVPAQGIIPQLNISALYRLASLINLTPLFDGEITAGSYWNIVQFFNPYLVFNSRFIFYSESNNKNWYTASLSIGNKFQFSDSFCLNFFITWLGFNHPASFYYMDDMIMSLGIARLGALTFGTTVIFTF